MNPKTLNPVLVKLSGICVMFCASSGNDMGRLLLRACEWLGSNVTLLWVLKAGRHTKDDAYHFASRRAPQPCATSDGSDAEALCVKDDGGSSGDDQVDVDHGR
ncbi:unnamed protein product [Durusdinium trenchii]|uniref:Uncharacterized protein n=1 Tax=Durusdinium trenchii TaxID=1381693 RepID=A0ABP0QQV1_9DINO